MCRGRSRLLYDKKLDKRGYALWSTTNWIYVQPWASIHIARRKPGWQQYLGETQYKFKNFEFPLMVTTKAYGMGIDHRGIRFVVHHAMPSGVEAYYQEIGRAGRDGNHAHCAILYRAPHHECVQRYLGLDREFVPADYSENDGRDALPPCLQGQNRTYNRCAPEIGLPEPCDLSRQLALTLRTYVQTDGFAVKCSEFWSMLEGSRTGDDLCVPVRASGTRNGQDIQRKHMFLHRLKQLGLVDDFRLKYRPSRHRFDVEFRVSLPRTRVTREQLLAALSDQTVLHTSDSDAEKTKSVLNELRDKFSARNRTLFDTGDFDAFVDKSDVDWAMAELYRRVRGYVLSMRMRSFRNLHNSLLSKQCSRFELLASMAGTVSPEYKCGFCSTCQPDLSFKRSVALPATGTPQMNELFTTFDSLLENEDVDEIEQLYSRAESLRLLPTIARRAANHLSYVPDSFPAFYVAGRSYVQSGDEREQREGRNQLSTAFRLANEQIKDPVAVELAYKAVVEFVPEHNIVQDLTVKSALDSAEGFESIIRDSEHWNLDSSTKTKVEAVYVHAMVRSMATETRKVCSETDFESDL